MTKWNEVIRDTRKSNKFSQARLGKEFGYSALAIHRFEHGSEPPIAFWQKFCNKFNLSLSWVLWGEEQVSPQTSLQELSTNRLREELIEREQFIKEYQSRLDKIRFDLILKSGTESFEILTQKIKIEQEKIIPSDIPNWLRNELRIEL
jgi:transcriptional regulator with XRE-family HTH domain